MIHRNYSQESDAATRADILRKVETQLKAEFDLSVGGQKLTKQQVQQSINNLYDAAIAPIGKSFDDAVKQFRDLELKVGNMTDTVTSRGGRKVIGKTVDRLIDAMSPQTSTYLCCYPSTDCCWCL